MIEAATVGLLKKGVVTNFAKFKGKHLCQSLFLSKVAALRPVTLLKRYSDTCFFLCILRNLQEHLFYRTPPGDCFCNEFQKFK